MVATFARHCSSHQGDSFNSSLVAVVSVDYNALKIWVAAELLKREAEQMEQQQLGSCSSGNVCSSSAKTAAAGYRTCLKIIKPGKVLLHSATIDSGRGVVSMANCQPHTNGSQFFILYKPAKHLNYKHTVFGMVVGGLTTLGAIEKVPVDDDDRPLSLKVMNEALNVALTSINFTSNFMTKLGQAFYH